MSNVALRIGTGPNAGSTIPAYSVQDVVNGIQSGDDVLVNGNMAVIGNSGGQWFANGAPLCALFNTCPPGTTLPPSTAPFPAVAQSPSIVVSPDGVPSTAPAASGGMAIPSGLLILAGVLVVLWAVE